jgi:quercetin dioxygenase-like cupin family protein
LIASVAIAPQPPRLVQNPAVQRLAGQGMCYLSEVRAAARGHLDSATTLGKIAMRISSFVSHVVIGCAGVFGGYLVSIGQIGISSTYAQAPAASQGLKTTELFNQVMEDVLGRRLTVRLTERDPGNGSPAHRHPGSHTVGYILEGIYEVKIDNGALKTLKPGEVFYEPPNALHEVSRNASTTQRLKYLVIQVSDPSKPATVPEK